MATIIKTEKNVITPVLYIDSINSDGYLNEVLNIVKVYLHKNNIVYTNDMCIKSVNELKQKNNGYWIISTNDTIKLYKKYISTGYIYNSVIEEEVFELKFVKCPKFVPQVLTPKKTLFENFSSELKFRVNELNKKMN